MAAARRNKRRTARLKSRVRLSIAVVSLLIAIPAYAYSLYVASPIEYSMSAVRMVASTGEALVSAAVPENPYSDVASQLSTKQTELDQREAALNARDHADPLSIANNYLGFASFFFSLIIFILLSINFYLDARRGMTPAITIPERFKVDMRNPARS